MTRAVAEWVGKTPDSKIPGRVRARVFMAQSGRCAECAKKMATAGEPFEVDHVQALILGGENRETNLRALCKTCHKAKTAQDVSQKATEARKRSKHLGLCETKSPLPAGKKSRWKKKIDGTVVLRD